MCAAVALTGAVVVRGEKRVIDHIDLQIEAARWHGLIGANGSGKTSLLRAIAGRLPFAEGGCAVMGSEMGMDRAGRARLFGFAPPPETLPGELRVQELFDLVGGDPAAVAARIDPLRAPLGLDGLRQQWVGNCSAGMRQRVAIALAFAGGQPLVILDEPFNWLDPVAAYDLRQTLRTMVDSGLTLITALHDLTTLALACDHGAMLADGRIALTMDSEALEAAARDPQAFERGTIDLLRAGSGTARK